MIHVQPPTETPDLDPAPTLGEAIAARAERRAVMLQRGAEMCLELAEVVHARALEQAAAGEDPGREVLAHSRALRALRQTVALGDRLDRARQVRVDAAEAVRAAEQKALDDVLDSAKLRGLIPKHMVYEALTDLILANAPERGELRRAAETLVDRLCERLGDAPDEDFADTPISELIDRVCEQMGIIPEWAFWEGANWAIEEARTELRGSPYVEGWEDEDEEAEADSEAQAEVALPP